MVRMCSGATPMASQIRSSLPVPAESWPPVMPVVRLSEMHRVMSAPELTASRRPVIPEWVKVESPITPTEGHTPLLAAPMAIVSDAPISTQVWIALNGDMYPRV